MKCSKCGKEIDHVLLDEFQYDGTDRDRLAIIEDLGDEVYGVSTDHNWVGDGLDDEDVYDTILCPKCKKFPFKSREIGRQELVQLTFWNSEDKE